MGTAHRAGASKAGASKAGASSQTVLSLSELVSVTGVPASTIHYYRRAGLIPSPGRRASNRFTYDERHVASIRLIRVLRDRQGLSLEEIGRRLPTLLMDPHGESSADSKDSAGSERPDGATDVRERVVDAAFAQFRSHTYEEVTVGSVADAAGVAKGSVYRYFASKEDLFQAVVEHLLVEVATGFAEAVETLGGAEGLAGDPQRTASAFAILVAGSLPVFLEVGAWAAKGQPRSMVLARQILRTLAEAVGRPLAPDDPGPAGLAIIESAFGTVLRWALEPQWPISR